jgi:hypothetical protein
MAGKGNVNGDILNQAYITWMPVPELWMGFGKGKSGIGGVGYDDKYNVLLGGHGDGMAIDLTLADGLIKWGFGLPANGGVVKTTGAVDYRPEAILGKVQSRVLVTLDGVAKISLGYSQGGYEKILDAASNWNLGTLRLGANISAIENLNIDFGAKYILPTSYNGAAPAKTKTDMAAALGLGYDITPEVNVYLGTAANLQIGDAAAMNQLYFNLGGGYKLNPIVSVNLDLEADMDLPKDKDSLLTWTVYPYVKAAASGVEFKAGFSLTGQPEVKAKAAVGTEGQLGYEPEVKPAGTMKWSVPMLVSFSF